MPSAVVLLLGVAVLLLGMESFMRGPILTLVIIAAVGMVLRNEQTVAAEFGKVVHGAT